MTDSHPTPPATPNDTVAIWREPVRGGYPDPALADRSAAEQLQSQIRGETPAPPLSRLTGMEFVAIGEGTAEFEMPLSDWLRTPTGAISVGPLTIPADAAVACAILTLLPPQTALSTHEFSLRLMAPVRPGGRIRARGRVIQRRTTLALADVAVTDEDDALVAHGSSLCVITPMLGATPAPGAMTMPGATPSQQQQPRPTTTATTTTSAIARDQPDNSPDPYLRPAAGGVLAADERAAMSGLEALRGQLEGRLPAPPIEHLTGLRLERVASEEVTLTLPASEWFCAPPRNRVQGGVVAVLAEAAMACAIQARLPAGIALAPIDIKVNYLRPLAADGRRARGRGWSVHVGRRLAVAHAEIHDADGRAIAVATGSAMLSRERPTP